MTNKSSPAVSGFGLAVVDVLMEVNSVTLNHKNPVDVQLLQLGGVIPTALVTLSRLGIPADLFSAVGDDAFSDLIIAILRKEGVETEHIVRLKQYTAPLSVVAVEKKNGERTGFNAKGSFSDLNSRVFSSRLPLDTKLYLIDGHNPYYSDLFLKEARKHGVPVMMDLGNPKLGMEILMKESDIVIVPQAYWRVMWPNTDEKAIVGQLLKKGLKTVILTLGDRGCMIGSHEEVFYQPAYRVHAVDTNGAGDIFMGSFAYGILQNWDLRTSAKFACGAAALSCEIFGKEKKIPSSVKEVESFIASH